MRRLLLPSIAVNHSLATAANDFLVASGSGVFVKKTLAETKTILGQVFEKVADITLSADASKTISSALAPNINYMMIVKLVENTAMAYLGLRFNNDNGASNHLYNNIYWSSSVANQLGALSYVPIDVSSAGPTATAPYYAMFNFYGNTNHEVFVIGENTYMYTTTIVGQSIRGRYVGAADLNRLDILEGAGAGTMTGLISLYKMLI